ncbi:septum formation family protein [Polymorphospora sp. NPDC051019]|uniref:DUF4190 domain-containing protein n=1 Tax=Polymorphospora sp. NPDC051019 TaxID=3155725 RepID=UPI00342705DE
MTQPPPPPSAPPAYPVHPGAHHPAPGGYGPPGMPQPPRPVNGFAIASLVLALLTLIPLSVITGIVALVQIPRRGQRGKGLAIAGIAISGAILLSAIILGVAAEFAGAGDQDAPERAPQSRYTMQYVPGDCIEQVDENRTVDPPPVKCGEPHQGEVFAVFDMSGSAYPGDEAVWEYATKGCDERLPGYAPSADPDAEYMIYFPTAESWADGDRWVVCVAFDETPRTGSIRD